MIQALKSLSEPVHESPLVIVGLGASAGGLEAIEAFLNHLPAQNGMALVLILHLDPIHTSLTPELLARHSHIPVHIAQDAMALEKDQLYVIPPNVTLTIEGGRLKTRSPIEPEIVRTHIDLFFRSLADDQKELAAGVILSGAGTDGTVGLKAIKEQGGITLAQSPLSAQFDSMPLSAIATGLVDFVLPVEELPGQLMAHAAYLQKLKEHKPIDQLDVEVTAALPQICAQLNRSIGHDFGSYKPWTLVRRVERRLQVHRLDSVQSYLEKLETSPAENQELFKDLLIGVTQFFRDTEAFEALDRLVIPEILTPKVHHGHLRVWVPGCASGEEAYSIAILLCEQMAQRQIHQSHPNVQIFATDIDDQALGIARQGRYPANLLEKVSPERRERFFTPQNTPLGEIYQVNKQIRDMCIFSIHNLVRDPPFSTQHLISCRNLLIYLDANLQRRLVPVFFYALSPGGYLFLGPSESLPSNNGLFRELKERIFQRLNTAPRPPRAFLLPDLSPVPDLPATAEQSAEISQAIERLILEEYAPPLPGDHPPGPDRPHRR